MSVNFRESSLIESEEKQQFPVGFLLRYCLEECSDYESAVKMLSTLHVLAPFYVSVAGTRARGCVITRSEVGELKRSVVCASLSILVS